MTYVIYHILRAYGNIDMYMERSRSHLIPGMVVRFPIYDNIVLDERCKRFNGHNMYTETF